MDLFIKSIEVAWPIKFWKKESSCISVSKSKDCVGRCLISLLIIRVTSDFLLNDLGLNIIEKKFHPWWNWTELFESIAKFSKC